MDYEATPTPEDMDEPNKILIVRLAPSLSSNPPLTEKLQKTAARSDRRPLCGHVLYHWGGSHLR